MNVRYIPTLSSYTDKTYLSRFKLIERFRNMIKLYIYKLTLTFV